MKFSGELDHLITEVLLQELEIIKVKSSGFVSVMEYGAKGDGLNDDSESFKKAIEENKNIFIPAGKYLINENITISNDSDKHIYGVGNESEIFTNNDIEIFTFNNKSLVIEKLKLAHYTNSIRKNIGISFNNLNKLIVNEVEIVGTDTYKNSNFGLYVNNVTISTIKNSIFNNSRLDLTTWDIKIDKCWFWSVSQNYGIRTIGSCGNITITNSDFVPPFVDKTDYIFTSDTNERSWKDALNQGAIIIGDGSYAVNNVKIDSCYIDGNPARSGRGIVINEGCFNIIINNTSINLINDNFLTIDSAYNINVTNCNLSNYALDPLDKVKFVDVYKKGVQPTENINITNNIINSNNVVSYEPQPVICVNENSKVSIVDYNTFLGNSSKSSWETEIKLPNYDGTVEMSHNKAIGKGAHVFKSVGSFNVSSGSSGETVFLTQALKYPYTLRPERIHISAINKMLPKYRLQPNDDNNTQFYMAFEEPLSSDVEFFYTAEM
jgi:hypothetical protein